VCAAELLYSDAAQCVQVVKRYRHEKGTPLARRPLVIMTYLPLDESYAGCGVVEGFGRLTLRRGVFAIREGIKGLSPSPSLGAFIGSMHVSALPIQINRRASDSDASITSPMETWLPAQTVGWVMMIFMSISRSGITDCQRQKRRRTKLRDGRRSP